MLRTFFVLLQFFSMYYENSQSITIEKNLLFLLDVNYNGVQCWRNYVYKIKNGFENMGMHANERPFVSRVK